MLWKNLVRLKPGDFKRRSGVQLPTFHAMVQEVKRKEKENSIHPNRRRPAKHSVEDQVLMTLMYWREYRTMFHIGTDYGVSEATICRTIMKIENILTQSKKFKLPGKKAIAKNQFNYEIILVDATETPIERPKKNKTIFIREKRKSTR